MYWSHFLLCFYFRETLDTEEATYIGPIEKTVHRLERKIREIDKLLGLIRIKERQEYPEKNPENFNRMVPEYSEDQKGLIIWKDLLEEKLF